VRRSVTLEGLKIFCDVVRQRSFSRAAYLNAVSQSAASQAVSQIERRLGIRLIDRSRRPLTLTPEGRIYYAGCCELLDRYFAVEGRIRTLAGEQAAHLVVASIYSVGLYDMHQYVQRFVARHPSGSVRLEYLHPSKVYARVLNREADLGLVSFPRSLRGLRSVPWRDEPMVLVCPPQHRLASRPAVRFEDLAGEPFVAFDPDLAIRREIDRYLRRRAVRVNAAVTFDNIEAIKRGVEAGAGIAILPRPTVARELESGSLVSPEVMGLDLVRPMAIIYRRGRTITPAMESFIGLLKEGDNGSGNGQSGLAGLPRETSAARVSGESDG